MVSRCNFHRIYETLIRRLICFFFSSLFRSLLENCMKEHRHEICILHMIMPLKVTKTFSINILYKYKCWSIDKQIENNIFFLSYWNLICIIFMRWFPFHSEINQIKRHTIDRSFVRPLFVHVYGLAVSINTKIWCIHSNCVIN